MAGLSGCSVDSRITEYGGKSWETITVVGKARHMNGDREVVIRQMKGLQYFQFGNDWRAERGGR